jgi:hypothetical protein
MKHASCAALILATLFSAPSASSYSVLTHEPIIDSTWDSVIKPLLLKRFPASTGDDLKQAHAYAYGGSIIQDLGYYPFGSTICRVPATKRTGAPTIGSRAFGRE